MNKSPATSPLTATKALVLIVALGAAGCSRLLIFKPQAGKPPQQPTVTSTTVSTNVSTNVSTTVELKETDERQRDEERPGADLNQTSGDETHKTVHAMPKDPETSQNKSEPGNLSEEKEPPQYTVKVGDTLYTISRRYSISSRQLQYHNHIDNPRTLEVGTPLEIPDSSLYVPVRYPDQDSRFIWPLQKIEVTRGFNLYSDQHEGIDLRAPKGTRIRAAAGGVVKFSGTLNGYGNTVIIKHPNKIETLYAHTENNLVNEGERVNKGDTIATVGKTGRATGYHLHFEFIKSGRKLNPRTQIQKSLSNKTAASNNRYNGTIYNNASSNNTSSNNTDNMAE